jgi:hypothetical protein
MLEIEQCLLRDTELLNTFFAMLQVFGPHANFQVLRSWPQEALCDGTNQPAHHANPAALQLC